MAEALPRLRANLEFMPSPVEGRPGLLIRDPFRYSEATLIIPPALVEALQWFDGEHTELDLREYLVRLTGDLRVGDLQQHLLRSLSDAGFLDNEAFAALREQRHREFSAAPRREAMQAGVAYPEDVEALRDTLREWLEEATPPASDDWLGIAAPHVSPAGGRRSYAAAYAALAPEREDRVFVVLGTSHFGDPDRLGLTVKNYATPLGNAQTDGALVEWLAGNGGPAVKLEDYCHAIEHSLEFQVLFLQYLYGAGVRVLPILVGPFARSIHGGGRPEDDPGVEQVLQALRELAAREGRRLFWVLGVDLAHMGERYGDPFRVSAGQGGMRDVEEADRRRLAHVLAGDAAAFWAAVQEDRDPLKWCGASALYTFLRAVPQARGELLRYEQWNIDEASVVSFAAVAFRGM